MSTDETPGTRISRCLMVQYEMADISMRSILSELSPIFMMRLVADAAGIIHGGLAQVGMCGRTWATRSWTSWRALVSSVPFSKMSLIDDSCETDFERSSLSPGMPWSTSSIGTVTSSSTSAEELPSAIVWISTCGGANSGNTSTLAPGISNAPNTMSAVATKMTSQRNRRLRETIQRISAYPLSPSSSQYSPYSSSAPCTCGAPVVTTRVPTGGPSSSSTRSPATRSTSMCARTYVSPRGFV